MLLFDENLSPKLPGAVDALFPSSTHVHELGLGSTDDVLVWEEAKRRKLAVVSKDIDLYLLSLVRGHPPKVVWLKLGNCSTLQIEEVLRRNVILILEFLRDPSSSTLILRLP